MPWNYVEGYRLFGRKRMIDNVSGRSCEIPWRHIERECAQCSRRSKIEEHSSLPLESQAEARSGQQAFRD